MTAKQRPLGFTFLEILIVVGLLAAFVMVVGTRIGGGLGIAITNSGRVIAAELRHARQRAIATGQTHRWVIDLESQAFRVEQLYEVPDQPEDLVSALRAELRPPSSSLHFAPVENKWGSWRWLDDEAIAIDGVHTREGLVDTEAVAIGFAPDGGADLAMVELSDEHGNRMGIRVDAFTGAIRTLEGDELDEQRDRDLDYEAGETALELDDADEDEVFGSGSSGAAEDATL